MRRHVILLAALVWAALLSSVVSSGETAASPAEPGSAAAADPRNQPSMHELSRVDPVYGLTAPNGFARVEPGDDTFVAIGVDEPQGHLNMLVAGELNSGDFETMIRFDLPESMGTGAQITSARLRLSKRECVVDDPGPVALQARVITRSWDEDDVIWDRKPPSSGPVLDFDVPDPEVGGYFDLDVTEVVDGWYTERYENFGWVLLSRTDQQSRRCIFWSSESGSYPLAFPPLLEIDWTGGVTPTFTPTSSPTASNTPTPSITPTASDTPTPTNTLDVTNTPTATSTPTSAPVYLPINLKREDIYSTYTPEPRTPVPSTDVPPSETPTDEPTSEPTDEPTTTPEAPDLTFTLSEMGGSGMSGTGSLTQMGDDLMVDLAVAPDDSGVPHPAHIHEGSCAAQGPVVHPLEAVVSGISQTLLAMLDLAEVADGTHYVNVHESAQNPGNIIACGDIPTVP